jgi:pimeloyl-ACP methyl ester carboxylesterase
MSKLPIRNRLILVCTALITAYVGLSAAGGVFLMENALHVQRRPLTEHANLYASVAKLTVVGVENASTFGADGALLKGEYVQPLIWNRDSVILLHGVGDNREGTAAYVPMFLRAGYAVLLPDSRAHGESGGSLVTYGFLESEDVHRWIEWLDIRERQSSADWRKGCIDLFGESMGAAIALQATAGSPGVCAVVAEAPFSTFREIGYERIAQGTGLNVPTIRVLAWPMVEFAFLEARLRYGLDMDQISPQHVLALSHVPALLIAGLADRNIPSRHSRESFRTAGASCQLWEVPGAGHTAAASMDPVEFQRRVLGWFAAHSKIQTPGS